MNPKAFLAKSNSYFQQLGIKKETAIWEDGMRSTGVEGTFEWWYFDADDTATLNGGNVTVNGQKITQITQQQMGGRGKRK